MTSVETQLGRQEDISAAVGRATQAFAERASAEGLIDIGYGWIETPLGPMLAAATDVGLLLLGYWPERADAILSELARKVSPRILEDGRRLETARRQLGEYFEGRRQAFDIRLDRRLIHGFHRRVLDITERIPYGSVSTYRDVAKLAGNPRASRAAGNALGANPIPIVIPCHRVLRTGHGLGGYGGGLDKKQHLLELEGVRL